MRPRVAAAFAGCVLIWGSTFLAIRVGNETTPPVWAATLRLAIAAALLFALTLALRLPLPRGARLRGAVAWGALNLGVNLALLYSGEETVPSGISAVFFATVPLSTALLAALVGVEPLVARKLVAAVLAIGGVGVIFAGELGVAVPFLGLFTVLGAASAAALANVLLKRAPAQPIIPLNAVGSAVGATVCLGASLALGEDHALPTTAAAWLPILYLAIAGSMGAFVLFTWLVTHWSVTNASLVGVSAPIVAVILGALLKGEQRAPLTYLGAAIVIGAVLLALRGPSPARRPAAVATELG